MKSTPERHGRISVVIHWLLAMMLPSIWMGGQLGNLLEPGDAKTGLLKLHVTMGLLAGLLVAGRLVWKVLDGRAGLPPGITGPHALLLRVVHWVLMLLPVFVVLAGVGILRGSDLPINPMEVSPEKLKRDMPAHEGHEVMATLLMLVAVVHVVGVVAHQVRKGDVLSRMGIPWFARR